MIANATAHRRANAFARALDEQARADAFDPEAADPAAFDGAGEGSGSPGDRPADRPRRAHAADRYTDPAQPRMLALVRELAALPSPQLDPEVKTVQRAQLIAAMESAFSGGSFDPAKVRLPEQRDGRSRGAHRSAAVRLGKYRPRSRWGRKIAVGGLALGVTAGGFTGAAVASSDALPGDTLYGLKRSMEDIRLTLADDDADKGEVYLEMASTRLKEARRLMERSKAGPLDAEQIGEVRKALTGVSTEASEAHRLLTAAYQADGSLEPIRALAAFSDEQRVQWARLKDLLPDQLSREREMVTSVLNAIEDDVTPLRSLLPALDGKISGEHRGTSPVPDRSTGRQDPEVPDIPVPQRPGDEEDREGGPTASPKQPVTENGSLIDTGGGGGLLEPPKPSGQESSPPSGAETPKPGKKVTLPPLLPGLLPGLGLEISDD